jgi:hypothetical protein
VGLQRGIYGDALSAQLHQVMRLPEGAIVPGEKSFQRLLGRLLAVKGRIPSQGGEAARSISAPRRSSRARASQARVSAARTGSAGIEQSPLAFHRGWQGRSKV